VRGGHTPIRRTVLLFLRHKANGTPILPLKSDDVDAFKESPLYAICTPADDPSEMAASFMGPGPWALRADLRLPTCKSMHFTYRHKQCNIIVSHALKIIVRVEKSGGGKKRLFDIVVQFPVHILSVSWLSYGDKTLILSRFSVSLQPWIDIPARVF
jgi:hypothetical protein